jgi:outer membrane murein-binding lipoprotein Lpp
MLEKKMLLLLLVIPLLLLSGCVATVGKYNAPEMQSLKNQVSVLEKELRAKDEEIGSLRDALNTRGMQRVSTAAETKSRPNSKQIQLALKNAGCYQGAIDGKIGKQTRQAIEKFQKDNNLSVDGKAGKNTWSLLSKYLY